MYEWASERLEGAGYAQYEISNWAKILPGSVLAACSHNLQYWRNLPYLGIGAGAHGYAAGARTANVLSPAVYIQRLLKGERREKFSQPMEVAPGDIGGRRGEKRSFPATRATASVTPIDRQAEIGETMMMGLRLVEEGVSNRLFKGRFGLPLEAVFGPQIGSLQRKGLLDCA
jgi:oxygen-independent coproporphyrinogen-3 oxidase